jgi:hypothetical protein
MGTRPLGRRASRLARGATALALAGVLTGLPAAAVAADDPLDGLSGGLSGESTESDTLPGRDLPLPELPIEPGQAEPDGPPVTQDDDNVGHETSDPKAPAHGSAEVLDVELADEEVVDQGTTEATVEDDSSTSSSANVLALGGQTILGAEADSDGREQASAGDPLAPLCEGSSGALCATLLYADASASEDGPGSRSASSTGIAELCVGGDDPSGETCSGPIHAGALHSSSSVDRDADGHTSATSGSQVAGLCLQADATTGECTVAANVLSSAGAADSRTGEASRDSEVAGVGIAGTELLSISEPAGLTIQPDCASPSLVCLFLNQGETYGTSTWAGHAQEALHATILDGMVDAVVAQSETRVHQGAADTGGDQGGDGGSGQDVAGAQGGAGDGAGDGERAAAAGAQGGAAAVGGVLPDTGGVWSGLLALALGGIGVGALMLAWSRRALAPA